VNRLASRRQLCRTDAGQITAADFSILFGIQASHAVAAFAQICVGQNSAQLDAGQMAEEIETLPLIRPQFSLHRRGERPRGNPAEFSNALAEFLGLGLFAEALQGRFIEISSLRQIHALSDRAEQAEPKPGDGFVSRLHRSAIEFDPAAVGQFDVAARGTLQPLRSAGVSFNFRFPGRDTENQSMLLP
jgi:hypothetical protein